MQDFLAEGSVNKTGNKETLVNNAYNAFIMNVEVQSTGIFEEKQELEECHKKKLILENGLVNLPDPLKLVEGWFAAPFNMPNTIHGQIDNYLLKNDAGKFL